MPKFARKYFIQPAETIPRTMRQRGEDKEPNQLQARDYIQGEHGLGLTGGIVENIVVNATSAIEQSMLGNSATELSANELSATEQKGEREHGFLCWRLEC